MNKKTIPFGINCRSNRSLKFSRLARIFSGLLLVALLAGCRSAKLSEPPRTAIEQLLLSTAADRAIERVDFSWLKGKKIFVEEKYFESYDKVYVIGLIREHLSADGALLVKGDDQAGIIVEIRSGGLGLNTAETFVGIPSMAVPVPFSGPLQTPELAVYKSQRANSTGKFALFAYQRESGEHVRSTGAMSGRAHFYLYKILGIGWQRTDVPELFRHPKEPSPAKSPPAP